MFSTTNRETVSDDMITRQRPLPVTVSRARHQPTCACQCPVPGTISRQRLGTVPPAITRVRPVLSPVPRVPVRPVPWTDPPRDQPRPPSGAYLPERGSRRARLKTQRRPSERHRKEQTADCTPPQSAVRTRHNAYTAGRGRTTGTMCNVYGEGGTGSLSWWLPPGGGGGVSSLLDGLSPGRTAGQGPCEGPRRGTEGQLIAYIDEQAGLS